MGEMCVSKHHPHHATIAPVATGKSRPLWSVMIPTYNCAGYLRETLTSVLAQDPGPEAMQIEVVDDCSTQDDPAAVVAEIGRGRVGFYRQPRNVGHIANFDTCLQRSRGCLVHLLHGDDSVMPGFYVAMARPFAAYPEIGAAFCRQIYMQADGNWSFVSALWQPRSGFLQNQVELVATQQPIIPPALVVRRDVYERLGGFDQRLASCAEDWEMNLRIAAFYPIWYEAEPLALYRMMRTASLTSRAIRDGQNIRDARQAIAIYREYLPQAALTAGMVNKAHALAGRWALELAALLLAGGDVSAALVQTREALKCRRTVRMLLCILRLYAQAGIHRIRQSLRAASLRRPTLDAKL